MNLSRFCGDEDFFVSSFAIFYFHKKVTWPVANINFFRLFNREIKVKLLFNFMFHITK